MVDTVSFILILVVILAVIYKSIYGLGGFGMLTKDRGGSKVTAGKDKKMEMVLFTFTSV